VPDSALIAIARDDDTTFGILHSRYHAALKSRTLTNLYNERPQWLADAHRDLDAVVAAAYGWPADISEDDAMAKLLEMNLARAALSSEREVDTEEAANRKKYDRINCIL
jgi:hypothetical protein